MRLDHERPPAGPLRLLAAAVALLTRLPAGGEVSPTDLPRATAAFPAVGALVAGVAVAVRAGGEPLVGASAATVAAVLAVVAVTGALHEDGLADVADGLWGGRDPAARLAIMRDSHVGAYGVIALVGALGLQVTVLAPLSVPAFAGAAVAGHVLSRAAVPVLARWVAPADGSGLGAGVAGGPGWVGWLAVAVVAVGATTGAAAAAAHAGWAPVPLVAGGLAAWAVGVVLCRRVGGITGDGYGAMIVVVQVVAMASIAVLARLG
jgi:adenosylcobinamide-GDP ribazoletransferase